ncbi:Anaerobic sulfite reductase subunit A [Photobacterium damselae subsp. damselae]|uniref:anaerobic sulfite reductase subunit AsrA n=1 Tax=Photobacterium damselae TaxID=38293 RepID=UPI000D061D7F|nr:anaerobic sulfite reductase subunit AsrA [Photobacterium damselae]PSB78219.1 anaerobic sulfite reductase subunit A [Photobacterium damselae subsp. damselae]TGZ36066.1 Anaerobic sulfite reductase subunit A [Photobacterium damselae subsp. damselae]
MSKYLNNTELERLISELKCSYQIMAPTYEHFGGRFAHTDNLIYKNIHSASEIVWHEKSHFSAKEIIFPITQTLFHFHGDMIIEPEHTAKPTIVFLRACDIHALERLDYMFLENGGNRDIYYQTLRDKLKLILIECEHSFDSCFCVSMGTNETDNYAAAIRVSTDGAVIKVKDETLIPFFAELGSDREYEPKFVQENQIKVRLPEQVCSDPQKIRQILQNDPSWAEYDRRCIGCGRCTTSCPTCSCYSVFDFAYDENPTYGERRRQHTSCMVGDFTAIAGGHSFRDKTGERLRFRALHKVNDYKARQGTHHMCVGCGRCIDRCPQYISFTRIINRMTDIVENAIKSEQQ